MAVSQGWSHEAATGFDQSQHRPANAAGKAAKMPLKQRLGKLRPPGPHFAAENRLKTAQRQLNY